MSCHSTESKDNPAFSHNRSVDHRANLYRKKKQFMGQVKDRGTSILGEVRNVEISGPTHQLLCSEFHDFSAVFALAHSKINQIA